LAAGKRSVSDAAADAGEGAAKRAPDRQLDGARQEAWQAMQDGLADLEYRWHDLKSTLLQAGVRGRLPLGRLNRAIEGLRSALKVAEQQSKAVSRLLTLTEMHDPATPRHAIPAESV
jgi:hypothetical protein